MAAIDTQSVTADQALALARATAHSPLPVLLADAQATVLCASTLAQDIIARSKRLQLEQGRLKLTNGDQQRQLIALIGHALAGKAPQPRDSTLLLQIERDAGPLTLLVSGIPDSPDGLAAVYLHEPAFTARISQPILCTLYGLTPAEARVARLLVNGATTREIAQHNNTSLHTVRNQIKSVFTKTGANRQAQLAILLLTGPAHTR